MAGTALENFHMEESVTSETAAVKGGQTAEDAVLAEAGWAPMVEYSATRDADGAELTAGAHVKAQAHVCTAMLASQLTPLLASPSYASAARQISTHFISIQLTTLPTS